MTVITDYDLAAKSEDDDLNGDGDHGGRREIICRKRTPSVSLLFETMVLTTNIKTESSYDGRVACEGEMDNITSNASLNNVFFLTDYGALPDRLLDSFV